MSSTIFAMEGAAPDHVRALRDEELDLVGGGDVYMQGPRGSIQRPESPTVLPSPVSTVSA